MELDPSFSEKIPYLFEIFSKIPLEKPEISTLVLSQPSSTLNRVNHHTSFSMVVPSSIKPFSMNQNPSYATANSNESQREFFIDQNPMTFSMNQTPSYATANTNESQREFFIDQNPMTFTPNYNEMETMHDLLNTDKGILDMSKQNFFQYGETSKSRVISSLPPSLVYENQSEDHDQGNIPSDQKRQKKVHKDSEIQEKESNIRKGQWTRDEDGYIKSSKICTLITIKCFQVFRVALLYTLLVQFDGFV